MEYVFSPLSKIEALARAYCASDARIKMRMRNGMTFTMYLNHSIVNEFMNVNALSVQTDKADRLIRGSVLEVAKLCAAEYKRTPEELADAFIRVCETEFLDPAVRERIEANLRELEEKGAI